MSGDLWAWGLVTQQNPSCSAGLMISRKQDTELPTANHPHTLSPRCPRVGVDDTTGKVCVVISGYMDDMQQGLVVGVPPVGV